MPKYKGKDVKKGDVIEVPVKATVTAIGGGFINATPVTLPSNLVIKEDKAPAPAKPTTTATTPA